MALAPPTGGAGWFLAAFILATTLLSTMPTAAQDSLPRAILERYSLDGDIGAYRISVNAANVRERPETRAPRTELLKRGAMLKALGRVEGTHWYAVEYERRFIGFIYDKTVEPVLDSDLSDEQRLAMGLEPPTDPLEGLTMLPMDGAFVASDRDIPISARPEKGSRTVSKLRRGERIDAMGRPAGNGGWVAVGQNGRVQGFAQEDGLLRVIDASMSLPLTGKLQIEGGITCAYELQFKGRSAVFGEVYGSADFSGNLACARGNGLEMFSVLMFIIEGARESSSGDLHQVNMDLLELGDAERPFSVIMAYNSTRKVLTFDAASRANYIRSGFSAERPAGTIQQTLSSAIEIALNALNDAAWNELAGL